MADVFHHIRKHDSEVASSWISCDSWVGLGLGNVWRKSYEFLKLVCNGSRARAFQCTVRSTRRWASCVTAG